MLAVLQQVVTAQWDPSLATNGTYLEAGTPPVYERYVRIAVGTGVMLTPNLPTLFQTIWISRPSPVESNFTIAFPPDATDILVTNTNGFYTQTGNLAQFTLLPGATTFGWQYHTAQEAAITRQGRQYRIAQRVSDNGLPFQFNNAIHFTSPYEYVGALGYLPSEVTDSQAAWYLPSDFFPENITAPHRLQISTWLVDTRITDQPDLEIVTHSLSTASYRPFDTATITAVIRNRGTYATGAPAYINLYDRLSPTSAPTSPIDLADGWCGTAERITCLPTATFTNPIYLAEPGDTFTVTGSLNFTRTGRHQFYLQVDVFGGEVGLNLESDETNNLVWLGEHVRKSWLFLPLIRK